MYGFRVTGKSPGELTAISRHIHEMDDFVLGWYVFYGHVTFIVFAKGADAVSFKMRLPADLLEALETLTVEQSNTLIASEFTHKTEFRVFSLE